MPRQPEPWSPPLESSIQSLGVTDGQAATCSVPANHDSKSLGRGWCQVAEDARGKYFPKGEHMTSGQSPLVLTNCVVCQRNPEMDLILGLSLFLCFQANLLTSLSVHFPNHNIVTMANTFSTHMLTLLQASNQIAQLWSPDMTFT